MLRRGPQVLPASGLLTVLALAAHAASGALLSATLLAGGPALAYALCETALLAVVIGALLRAARLGGRTAQTLSALAGCGTLVNLAAAPVMLGVSPDGSPGGWAALAVLVLFAWSFAITAHVLRHALSVPTPAGAVAALGYFALSYLALGALFPVAGG